MNHTALITLLWTRCGRGLIAPSDVAACITALPQGRLFSPEELASVARALVAAGMLSRATERAWSLSDAAIASIAVADDSLSLSPDEERQLFDALQRSARGGALDRANLHAVTRRFLEDVLTGAQIPDELLEHIVEMYRSRGHLTMSDDGGRYTISIDEP
ncbi:MAG TPA: hypothetical protein VF618_20695 [Thermoanaerobaculia bacterium]